MIINGMNYILMTDWETHHKWPTLCGLRNIRALADKDDKEGPGRMFKKIGGRIFIDESAFFEWTERQLRG